jgi:predicted negative regulator of RcsB-dependent stress response
MYSWGKYMNRTGLYIVIAVLGVAAGVFGYQAYQTHERDKGAHIEIDVGKGGLSIQKN